MNHSIMLNLRHVRDKLLHVVLQFSLLMNPPTYTFPLYECVQDRHLLINSNFNKNWRELAYNN